MVLPRLRGGKSWFAFEAKSFEIELEEVKRGLKGCIWERRKGITSWIRFGGRSLVRLLMGLEDCARATRVSVWKNLWEEDGRRYKMEKGSNQSGVFIRCSVRDYGGKSFNLMFPEGNLQNPSPPTYTFLLKCLHVMDENVTHHVSCPEASPNPSHMHMLSMKTVIYVPSMTIFPKQILFFYKSKFIRPTPIFTCFYQIPCVFVGSEFPRSHRKLHMPSDTFANFHRWIHMSNQEYRVFHLRGYLSLLAIPNPRIFHFLFSLMQP